MSLARKCSTYHKRVFVGKYKRCERTFLIYFLKIKISHRETLKGGKKVLAAVFAIKTE